MSRIGQKRLGIYVTKELHEEIVKIAKRRNITFSQCIRRILLRYIIKERR
jgi:hypothetical protein